LAIVSLSATTPSQSKMISSGTTFSAIDVTMKFVWKCSHAFHGREIPAFWKAEGAHSTNTDRAQLPAGSDRRLAEG
jgi:hypothetical protein